MVYLGRVRLVWILVVIALLIVPSLGQTTPVFRVNEQQIKFRLDAHPVLELPVVNASDKALAGNFRLELLGTNDKVESLVTGTFHENPGTTVEKVAWPLDSLVSVSPSSLGWRRLHYSLTPRPELGVAPRSTGTRSGCLCAMAARLRSRGVIMAGLTVSKRI